MPYATRKVPNRRCFKVYNRKTKRVFAKFTSKSKARRQINLLRALQNNKTFKNRLRNVK